MLRIAPKVQSRVAAPGTPTRPHGRRGRPWPQCERRYEA